MRERTNVWARNKHTVHLKLILFVNFTSSGKQTPTRFICTEDSPTLYVADL